MIPSPISPAMIRWTSRFGLWSLATWLVLRLHEMPIAGEHSVCGLWGCGPTIPALLSAHGFWLMVLIPVAIWAPRRLGPDKARWVGSTCLVLGLGGMLALALNEAASWPGGNHPELRSYLGPRILFIVATTVEIPLIPLTIAGLILLIVGRKRTSDGCNALVCGMAGSDADVPDPGTMGLGSRLPDLRCLGPDGSAINFPTIDNGRALILYFMRDAACSICRGHVRSLINLSDQLDAQGIEVVIVQPGGIERSRALARSLFSPYLVASARQTGAYRLVGLSGRGFGLLRGSGTVLIDGQGLIRFQLLASLPYGGFSGPKLVEAIESLRPDEVNPVSPVPCRLIWLPPS